MTGSINNDVLPKRSSKWNLRRVDRDVLRLLLEESVQQECIFELHSFRRTCSLDARDLPFRQRARVVQQAANQGRLAMIHMADEHDLKSLRVPAHMNPFARSFCIAFRS